MYKCKKNLKYSVKCRKNSSNKDNKQKFEANVIEIKL